VIDKMGYIYTSPMVGFISTEVFYLLAKRYGLKRYLKEYAELEKRTRIAIPAILEIEHKAGGEIWTGREIYGYLINRGYSSQTSTSVMKLFAANANLVSELMEEGHSEDYALYSFTYLTRMHKLGYERVDYRPSYAMGMDINIYPIEIYHVEPPEPPEPPEVIYEEWRPFQISMLVDCTSHDSDGSISSTRKIEFRGVFSAEKSEIVDWSMLGTSREVSEDMLRSAGVAAELSIEIYAKSKGYEDLIDMCAKPEFYGANLLESIDSDFIDENDTFDYVTEALFEVIDMDNNKVSFTDKVSFTGEWWKDHKYYENEISSQVFKP